MLPCNDSTEASEVLPKILSAKVYALVNAAALDVFFSSVPNSLAQPLKIALRNQAFHVAMADVELAVLRQGDGSVGVSTDV
jgi:hypothetical protein